MHSAVVELSSAICEVKV